MFLIALSIGLSARPSGLVTRRGAGGALLAAASFSLLPRSAFAVNSDWAGRWSDPGHPDGFRELSVKGKTLTIVGRDAPDAPKWTLSATVADSSATIDFSPKGGPKDLPAKLEGAKIVFPDGNAWTKVSPWIGRYSDPNHPTGFRDVTVTGNDLTIVGRDSPTGAEWTLRARVDASGLASTIDFTPKGGPRDLPAKLVGAKIVFPDGNAWTKML